MNLTANNIVKSLDCFKSLSYGCGEMLFADLLRRLACCLTTVYWSVSIAEASNLHQPTTLHDSNKPPGVFFETETFADQSTTVGPKDYSFRTCAKSSKRCTFVFSSGVSFRISGSEQYLVDATGDLLSVSVQSEFIRIASVYNSRTRVCGNIKKPKQIERMELSRTIDFLCVEYRANGHRGITFYKRKDNRLVLLTSFRLKALDEWFFISEHKQVVVVSSEARNIRVINCGQKTHVVSLSLPEETSISSSEDLFLSASQTGDRFACHSSKYHCIFVWNTITGDLVAELRCSESSDTQISLSNTGKYVSILSRKASVNDPLLDDELTIVEISTRKSVFSTTLLGNHGLRPIIFSPNDLFFAEAGAAFRLWDRVSKKMVYGPVKLRPTFSEICEVAARAFFSRDGRWVTVFDNQGNLKVFELVTMQPLISRKLNCSGIATLVISNAVAEITIVTSDAKKHLIRINSNNKATIGVLWKSLESLNPAEAYLAQIKLLDKESDFLELVQEESTKIKKLVPSVNILMKQLGDQDFKKRDEAMKCLQSFLPLHRRLLLEHLTDNDLEIVVRIRRLLDRPTVPVKAGRFLRHVRCLHVLAAMGKKDMVCEMRNVSNCYLCSSIGRGESKCAE